VRRAALVERLQKLPPEASQHPAYRNIRNLLGPTFIKSKIGHRLAVLQSADWLMGILETLTMI